MKTFELHDYDVGNQAKAEMLLSSYTKRDFKPIIKYCKRATAFQDIPFSLPYTFQVLDYAFPNSKFILTVRDNENQWYNSLVRFHSKLFGKNGNLPTKQDLQAAIYRYKGFIWDANRVIYNTPEYTPYHGRIMKEHYLHCNKTVKNYFRYKENLLIINISHKQPYIKFCDFLGLEPKLETFFWKNKTSDI